LTLLGAPAVFAPARSAVSVDSAWSHAGLDHAEGPFAHRQALPPEGRLPWAVREWACDAWSPL